MRTSSITALLISLPLFIWTWGLLMYSDNSINPTPIINSALTVLWGLQVSIIILLVPLLMREYSLTECCTSILVFILTPLPFVVLAWLITASNIFHIIKFFFFLVAISCLTFGATYPFTKTEYFNKFPIKIEKPLCFIASTVLWLYREQWLNWIS